MTYHILGYNSTLINLQAKHFIYIVSIHRKNVIRWGLTERNLHFDFDRKCYFLLLCLKVERTGILCVVRRNVLLGVLCYFETHYDYKLLCVLCFTHIPYIQGIKPFLIRKKK